MQSRRHLSTGGEGGLGRVGSHPAARSALVTAAPVGVARVLADHPDSDHRTAPWYQAAEPQAGTDRGTGTRLPSRLDVRFTPDFFRSTPSSRRSRDLGWTSAYDPACVKTIFCRPRRDIESFKLASVAIMIRLSLLITSYASETLPFPAGHGAWLDRPALGAAADKRRAGRHGQ